MRKTTLHIPSIRIDPILFLTQEAFHTTSPDLIRKIVYKQFQVISDMYDLKRPYPPLDFQRLGRFVPQLRHIRYSLHRCVAMLRKNRASPRYLISLSTLWKIRHIPFSYRKYLKFTKGGRTPPKFSPQNQNNEE